MSKDKKIEIEESTLVIPEKRLRVRTVQTEGFEEFRDAIKALVAGSMSKEERDELGIDEMGKKIKEN